MKLIISALAFVTVQGAHAAPPTPNQDVQEKVEDIRSTGGAIKVEDKPAVDPEVIEAEKKKANEEKKEKKKKKR